MQLELEAGKTVLGTAKLLDPSNGVPLDFTVYYGNALSPIIDGNVVHLPPDDYLAMLDAFLNDEQLDPKNFPGYYVEKGGEYEIPTKKQVEDAIAEMVRRERIAKQNIARQEQEKTNQKLEEYKKSKEELENSKPEEEDEAKESDASKDAPIVQDEMKDDEEDEKKAKFLKRQEEKFENFRARKSDNYVVDTKKENMSTLVIALLSVLIVLLLVAAGYLFYLVKESERQSKILEPTSNNPVTEIQLGDSDKKVIIYSVTVSTNQEGGVDQSTDLIGIFDYSEDMHVNVINK